MAYEIQVNAQNEEEHLSELKKYMIRNNYYYTFPYDDCIPFQYKKIDKNLLKIQFNVRIRILKQKIIWICSIIKHKILKIK